MDKPLRLSCTEAEFLDTFRAKGFLSPYIEEAVPGFVQQHTVWFAHAEALIVAGLDTFNRRDNEIIGLSSHSPTPLAMRMIYRALSAAQGAVILFRRGMTAEGDTLTRNVYETAFWLGFINNEAETACAAFVSDERKSQKGRAEYYLEQFKTGAYAPEPEIEAKLATQIAELRSKLKGAESVSPKTVAERSGLYAYYDAYKHLSAASAHNSLNSLNRYLKRNPDGSYDGHIVGPDNDGLPDSLSVLCVGLGLALVMFGTVVAIDDDEAELQALLIQTDELRKQLKDSGGGLAMVK